MTGTPRPDMEAQTEGRVVLMVDEDNVTGRTQVSINLLRPDGSGHGYRILGPKYVGNGGNVAQKALSKRDAVEIVAYLRPLLDEETEDDCA